MTGPDKRHGKRRITDSAGSVHLTHQDLEQLTDEVAKKAMQNLIDVVDQRISLASEGIAERAAELGSDIALRKATDRFYRNVGRGVVHKSLVILGIIAVAAVAYLQSKGYFIDVDG